MDELRRLVENAQSLVKEGYYRVEGHAARSPSFLDVLGTAAQPSDIIAEIKFASPTSRRGKPAWAFSDLLDRFVAARPLGLSILAEPRIFGGGLAFLREAADKGLPVLMKDIVVDSAQVEAAAASGASAVLVIETLFARGLVSGSSQALIDAAHERDLEVVLEVHTLAEWDAAVKTDADILGINNRDLTSMEVELSTTASILSARHKDRPAIAMSGIDQRGEVEALLRAGADAVLVGSSIMAHPDPARKLEELIHG